MRVYGRGIGRVCGCLCRAFLGRSVRKPGARGKRLLVGGDPRRGAGSGFRAESRSGEPAFTDYQRGTRRAGYKLAPPALLWLGIGFRATVFLIALAGFFPAYLNAAAGAASVPPVLIRAGRMLGFGGGPFFSGS